MWNAARTRRDVPIADVVTVLATLVVGIAAQGVVAGRASAQQPTSLLLRTGTFAGDWLGHAVAGVGDVDHDGRDDLIVGAYGADPNGAGSGMALLLSGGDGHVIRTFVGDAALDEFGYSVDCAGDVDDDGFDDIVIGAPGRDVNGIADVGTVRIYSGRTGGIIYSVNGVAAGDGFGFCVRGLGDVNGDLRSDVFVGAPRVDVSGPSGVLADAGAGYVIWGINGTVTQVGQGANAFANFGFSAAGRGDFDGDRVPDLLIGAYGDNTGGTLAGSVIAVSGSTGAQFRFTGGAALARMGWSVAFVGDIDQDDHDDFAIGVPGDSGGGAGAGAVIVVSGRTMAAMPGRVFRGVAGDHVGESVSAAGDADLDGTPDILVGMTGSDLGGVDSGAIRLYSGATGGALYTMPGAAAGDELGKSVTLVGRFDGDAFPDIAAGAWHNDAGGTDAGAVRVWSGLARPPDIVRISPKRVLGRAGVAASPWDVARIQTMVADASSIFERLANVRLQLEPIVDVVDPGDPVPWNGIASAQKSAIEQRAETEPCDVGWRTDAVNVYLVTSLVGAEASASFPHDATSGNDLLILRPPSAATAEDPDPEALELAHELGHYFNLRHTHANFEGLGGGCAGGNAGDCVRDTPDDVAVAPCRQTSGGIDITCFNQQLTAAYVSNQVRRLLFYDLMSYHALRSCANCAICATCPECTGCYASAPKSRTSVVLTPGQVARLRRTLPDRARVVVGNAAPGIAAVTTLPDPAGVRVIVTGSNLPTSVATTLHLGDVIGDVPIDTSASSSSSLSAVVPLLQPGWYCVGVREAFDLVGFRGGDLQVRPMLRTSVAVPGPVASLQVESTAQSLPVFIGYGTLLPTPVTIPGWDNLLLVNGTDLVATGTTNAQARFDYSVNVSFLPVGYAVWLQAAEFDGVRLRLTNARYVAMP